MSTKKVRILSIDGGGIRGIIPGVILDFIEQAIREKAGDHKRLADYFDFIAGTSTGGILTCLYLLPDENKRPKYSASQAVNLYLEKGAKIFRTNFWHSLVTLGGLIGEKYPARNIEKFFLNYFGNAKLKHMLRICLITAYDIHNRKAYFFNPLDASNGQRNFYIRDIVRATSAAPTYFEATKIKSMGGNALSLIDGGVFAGNPALCAYAEARNIAFSTVLQNPEKPNYPTANEMFLVSIATGSDLEKYCYPKVKHWGKIRWIKPIIKIMMSGNAETVNYQLKQIFTTTQNPNDYIRLSPKLGKATSALDDARPVNLTNLKNAGNYFIAENKQRLEYIVDKLIEYD